MTIYSWEQDIIDIARTWPTTGPIYNFMEFVSDFKQTAYIFIPILIILIWKIGAKRTLTPVALSIVSVALTETISRRVVKALVMRPRPNFLDSECLTSACWGFISSHAANMFGIAILLSLYDKRNLYWSIPAAIIVSFSRIYLIDHYPMDVIGGAIVGSLTGLMVWLLFNKIRSHNQKYLVIKRDLR